MKAHQICIIEITEIKLLLFVLLSVLWSVHHVVLMSLDMVIQRGVFGDPPHPRQDEAVGEAFSTQRAPPLCCQDTVYKMKTVREAVLVLLIKPETQTGG